MNISINMPHATVKEKVLALQNVWGITLGNLTRKKIAQLDVSIRKGFQK